MLNSAMRPFSVSSDSPRTRRRSSVSLLAEDILVGELSSEYMDRDFRTVVMVGVEVWRGVGGRVG